jgi:hypothetical protein
MSNDFNMYEDSREGMLKEYSEKIMAEFMLDPEIERLQGHLHQHFIRGFISDIIDRVIENPEKYKS